MNNLRNYEKIKKWKNFDNSIDNEERKNRKIKSQKILNVNFPSYN